jgi:hypothetical protein
MFRWIDILAGAALIALVVLLIIHRRRGPLPDQIKHIQGKPIELRATHTGLLGGTVYDASCASCSDAKVVPIIPSNPFDVVEIQNFLVPSECAMFAERDTLSDPERDTQNDLKLESLVYKRAEEWMGMPSSRFGSYQLQSPFNGQSQYDSSIISIYVFLNDDYTGGELDFPLLLKTIRPKKGKAVIWRNMDSKRELIMESVHREMMVTEGQKWVCRLAIEDSNTNSKENPIL